MRRLAFIKLAKMDRAIWPRGIGDFFASKEGAASFTMYQRVILFELHTLIHRLFAYGRSEINSGRR